MPRPRPVRRPAALRLRAARRVEDKFPRAVLPGTFDFGFTTGLSYKDVRLCVDEAEAMGVPMVCGAVVRQMLAITNAKYRRVIRLHLDRESAGGMGRRGNARLEPAPSREERLP